MSSTDTNEVSVPALRFPGFADPWRSSTLGKETNYTKGFAFKSQDYRKLGVRIIRVSDLAARHIKKDNDNVHVEESRRGEFSKWRIRKNEIVITTVGSRPDLLESAVGRGIFIDGDDEGLLNQNMLKLESVNGNASQFVFSQINTPRYTYYISQIKRGNANQANITVKDLMAYRITVSALPEQRKIADFLSSVDKRIEQLTQKKSLLEQYKKGVMQQLFTQAIRFKDDEGKDFPDWEEKKLLDILQTVSPRGHQIESTEILSEGRHRVIDQGKSKVAGFSNLSEKLISNVPVIVFGDHTTTLKYIDFEFIVGADGTKILKCQNPEYDLRFFYFNLLHNNIQQEGYKRHFSILKEVKLQLPPLPEQTKIADFLSALDRKIESVATQITETQTFKKGLLQQMFV
jgi:type I restriction enzyme, S subunit